jgi:hypothetical protein
LIGQPGIRIAMLRTNQEIPGNNPLENRVREELLRPQAQAAQSVSLQEALDAALLVQVIDNNADEHPPVLPEIEVLFQVDLFNIRLLMLLWIMAFVMMDGILWMMIGIMMVLQRYN